MSKRKHSYHAEKYKISIKHFTALRSTILYRSSSRVNASGATRAEGGASGKVELLFIERQLHRLLTLCVATNTVDSTHGGKRHTIPAL